MNAPVATADLTAAAFEQLPLTTIAPSETPSQARRRKRYTEESIAELARSMAGGVGVIEPVIVRKLAALRGLAAYELVAGERRWLAAEKAGLAHIPAIVRDISDADLVAFQLIENLQRQSVHPLEEAEAYRDLMQDKKLDAPAVGALVGVSRTQVYNRLKLLDLKHPAALDAFEAGRIDQSKALRLARIPTLKLQLRGLELIADPQVSDRQAAELLREKLMVRLDDVPFDLTDATFETLKPEHFDCQRGYAWTTQIPACTACRNCSQFDEAFHAEVEEAYGRGARVCTDRACHDQKVKMFFERRISQARAAGAEIIEGDAAREAKPYSHTEELRGYIDLDAECDEPIPVGLLQKIGHEPEMQRNPTYRELLGEAGKPSVLIDPHNRRPREVLPLEQAAKLLKKKGVDLEPDTALAPRTDLPPDKTGRAPAYDPEAARRAQERQEQREALERGFRRKLLDAVRDKWKGPLKREDLQAIADRWLAEHDAMDVPLYDWYYDGHINTAKMSERDLTRLLLELALWSTVEYLGESPEHVLALAKRLRIDPVKVKKEVQRELGIEPEKKAAKKKPAGNKPGKKAKKK